MLLRDLFKLFSLPANLVRVAGRRLFINTHAEESQANRLSMLGCLVLFGFPLYYWVWMYWYPQQYENLALRMVGVAVMSPCFFARRLHREKWFDTYFFCAITYVFPFFFIFMFLMNEGSPAWSQSLLIALVVLFHFDGKFALFSCIVGTILAYFSYVFAVGHYDWPHQEMFFNLPIFAFAILSVSIVKIGRGILIEEKLRGMASALGVISHELRTPLRSVDASARGLKRYLPALVEFYEKHHQALEPESLYSGRLVMMEAALDRIQADVQYMNSAIDLLLTNAGDTRKKAQITRIFTIQELVVEAIERYPFENENQRALVRTEFRSNYPVAGNEDLCMMVLFNLLKNALRAIAKAGKGDVSVTTDGASDMNRLIFRDTGCGIPESELLQIFRRFHSYPSDAGTGIGLAFVHDTLEAWGAKISCHSKENAYTEFVIQFPAVESNMGYK